MISTMLSQSKFLSDQDIASNVERKRSGCAGDAVEISVVSGQSVHFQLETVLRQCTKNDGIFESKIGPYSSPSLCLPQKHSKTILGSKVLVDVHIRTFDWQDSIFTKRFSDCCLIF